MLVPNQKVEIKWRNNTRSKYEAKGYKFTNYGDSFLVDVNDLLPSSRVLVDVQCDYCGEIYKMNLYQYNININKAIPKCACLKCAGLKLSESDDVSHSERRKKLFDEFIDICNEKGYTPVSDHCDNATQYLLEFICPEHGLQTSTLEDLRKRDGCLQCKKDAKRLSYMGKRLNEFEKTCADKGYISLAKLEDCIDIDVPLPFLCPIHGIKYGTIHNMKYNGHGCPECGYETRASKLRLSQNDVRKEIESKNGNVWNNPGEYKNAVTNNLEVICGSCSNIFLTSQNNYRKNITGKCPECNVGSYGEYLVGDFLKQSHLKYTTQETFNGDCRDKGVLRFDFYVPDYNLCIEFDGQQHFTLGNFQKINRGKEVEEMFEDAQRRDQIKNDYCKSHNINLLRIPYWEMDNINSILGNYFKTHFKVLSSGVKYDERKLKTA